jgi:NitT/TauT family transport system ATP-binding protein
MFRAGAEIVVYARAIQRISESLRPAGEAAHRFYGSERLCYDPIAVQSGGGHSACSRAWEGRQLAKHVLASELASASATTSPAVPSRASAAAGTSATIAIDIRDLSLTYPTADTPVIALADVSLSIRSGEFVSFIGPSGCGKTTLMRVIADLAAPTAGRITVNGVSPRSARLNRAYGYVFQAPALYAWRNVLRNVMLPLEIMGMPRPARVARATKYLTMVGLAGFERKFPWQLSGGMQQRVSIARALAFEPQLLLMDEPFGALDEITRDHLNEELLRLWNQTRKTIVFVTHSISEAVFLSNRIVVMSPRPGRILEIIDNDLPAERGLDMRETAGFLQVAHRVRQALRAGHSYDD